MIVLSPQSDFRVHLLTCLGRLASPADQQVAYLKALGTYPSADELALELHELVLISREQVTGGALSIAERSAIDRLDQRLGSFSGPQYHSLWYADALASADEWREVRDMARECLRLLEGPSGSSAAT